jgi:peptidoglycan/xylan/chitin deacetylase (PgdA/CDA1 family)
VTRLRSFLARIVKELLGRLLVATGQHGRELDQAAVVVAFHSVTRDLTDGALRCSERDFEKYCGFFARHMRVEALTDFIARLKNGESARGALCVTFDDGYADNAEIAAPILAKWRLPAVFYVATDFIGSATQTFWDVKAGLKSRWMTWEQVRALAAAGHEIGAHTISHADLSRLGPEQIKAELAGSRAAIAAKSGAEPVHFAVPFGRDFDSMPVVSGIARELGFQSVSLCRGGLVPDGADAMRFERWPIGPGGYISPYGWIFDVVMAARRLKMSRAARELNTRGY